jgi:hypothetical protein
MDDLDRGGFCWGCCCCWIAVMFSMICVTRDNSGETSFHLSTLRWQKEERFWRSDCKDATRLCGIRRICIGLQSLRLDTLKLCDVRDSPSRVWTEPHVSSRSIIRKHSDTFQITQQQSFCVHCFAVTMAFVRVAARLARRLAGGLEGARRVWRVVDAHDSNTICVYCIACFCVHCFAVTMAFVRVAARLARRLAGGLEGARRVWRVVDAHDSNTISVYCIACFCVHCFAVTMASFSLLFQCSATSFANGSSGFGAESSA